MTREKILEHRRMLRLKYEATNRKLQRIEKEIEIWDAILKKAPASKIQQILQAYEEL